MKKGSSYLSAIAGVLFTVGACAPLQDFDDVTQAQFAVPDICNADMRIESPDDPRLSGNLMCMRELLPLAQSYGEETLEKLDYVIAQKKVPKDKVNQAVQMRKELQVSCIDITKQAMQNYDGSMESEDRYYAIYDSAASVQNCFGKANLVMDGFGSFGALSAGEKLENAASRAYYGLYLDDPVISTPPGLYLGPRS